MKVLLVGEGLNELSGALETLVRRLGLTEADIDCDLVKRAEIHAHHGKGQGFFKRAVRWMLEAHKRGYEALILVIDEDGFSDRVKQFTAAQQSTVSSLPRALGVAIRTFDAWMIADEQALSQTLGYGVPRQSDPESISNPKRVAHGLIDNSGESTGLSQAYARVSKILDIEMLKSRCHNGFAPFAERVTQM
jgi:hypothetical protein